MASKIMFNRTDMRGNKGYIRVLALSLITALLFSMVILGSACEKETEASLTESTDSGSKATVSTTAAETSPAKTTSTDKSSESVTVTETTAEEIPRDITDLINEADNYYADGEYALAVKTYRNAQLAIEDSDLTKETKEQQINTFMTKYGNAKEIVNAAKQHVAYSKNLQYQQRYEEAMRELEAALEIYPKYQEAIDELKALRDLMGLE